MRKIFNKLVSIRCHGMLTNSKFTIFLVHLTKMNTEKITFVCPEILSLVLLTISTTEPSPSKPVALTNFGVNANFLAYVV